MTLYDRRFYQERHARTKRAAERILPLILDRMPTPRSAVDIGCGAGVWLSVLRSLGVADIRGIDGSWVDRDLLQISEDEFTEADLSELLSLDRRYDLTISLEVAEHLPAQRAEGFVKLLTDVADFVLFSAAIPHQQGTGHVNEQWQKYWADRFRTVGYVPTDFIRHEIWADADIPVFYRQNILFYVKEDRLDDMRFDNRDRESVLTTPLSVVHPAVYSALAAETQSVKSTFHLFRAAVGAWIRKKLGKFGA